VEYRTYSKKEEGELEWSHIAKKLPFKTGEVTGRRVRRSKQLLEELHLLAPEFHI
jgi:hypothetical protein